MGEMDNIASKISVNIIASSSVFGHGEGGKLDPRNICIWKESIPHPGP